MMTVCRSRRTAIMFRPTQLVLPLVIAVMSGSGVRQVQGYWREECHGAPGEWLLPENHALDCSLRSVALEYATTVALRRHRRLGPIAAQIHHGLNLSACGVPVPDLSATASSGGADGAEAQRAAVIASLSSSSSSSSSSLSAPAVTEIFVSASVGDDAHGTGARAQPFASLARAQKAVRAVRRGSGAGGGGAVVVWLRQGVYYQPHGPLTLTAEDSGLDAGAPVVWAGWPSENVTISGAAAPLPSDLGWAVVPPSHREAMGLGKPAAAAPLIYRARLPLGFPRRFMGLFANGVRLTRARYPNCADITGHDCYTLNASGPTSGPTAPTHDLKSEAVGYNVEVINQHGVDMFADRWDNARGDGPHGASDGTLPSGTSLTLHVEHPDYAWRCHEDCGWVAYSKWRGVICDGRELNTSSGLEVPLCRHTSTFNEPYWNQQVSGGFYFNGTAAAQPWAPAWTTQSWANASSGVVHMYHSSRWGGWQFALAARNDTDSSLLFQCTLFGPKRKDGTYLAQPGGPVPCPPGGGEYPALVHGGWQEGRGAAIGPQYTMHQLNNSYFVEVTLASDACVLWLCGIPCRVSGSAHSGSNCLSCLRTSKRSWTTKENSSWTRARARSTSSRRPECIPPASLWCRASSTARL